MKRLWKLLRNQRGEVALAQDPPAQDNPFLLTLPEDVRADPSLKPFKDAGGLAKSYIDTKKMVGNSIRLPDEGAAEDVIAKWKEENLPKLTSRKILSAPPSEYKVDRKSVV